MSTFLDQSLPQTSVPSYTGNTTAVYTTVEAPAHGGYVYLDFSQGTDLEIMGCFSTATAKILYTALGNAIAASKP